MAIKAAHIAGLAGAKLLGPHDNSFTQFAFDSRRIHSVQPTCFIAIKTEHADGHQYIDSAILAGAKTVICSKTEKVDSYPSVAFIIHPKPLEVLRAWGREQRKQVKGEVIAITGSNGKTVVKEWLYELLGSPEHVHRTHASFNSSLGVPLTLSALRPQHRNAIVEVGIDRPGQMEHHAKLVQPTLGIFTTLGDAHGEHFESDRQKFEQKWKLFASCRSLVLSRNHYNLAVQLKLPIPNKIMLWGKGEVLDPEKIAPQSFKGEYHVANAMAAVGGALHLGASMKDIKKRLALLQPLEMRMQLRGGKDGGYLLEDTYSSDLNSLRWALEELVSSAPTVKKWAVLSHLGNKERTVQAKELVKSYSLDRVWWVEQPEDVPELTASFSGLDLGKITILIKGQRKYKLEQFAATLQDQYHSTWAEVNLSAMRRNLQKFKAVLRPETKVMAMVKAASYGSGTLEVARWLQSLHVDYLGVAFAQEALRLRAQGINMPILVLNVDAQQMPMLATAQTEVELFSRHQLDHWLSVKRNEVLKVHLKINTGMNRLGFKPEALPELLGALAEMSSVEVVGVFSHLAAADDASKDSFTKQQLAVFEEASAQVKTHYPAAVSHILNTHGIHRFGSEQKDMVRLGIGLYGVGTYQGIEPLEEVIAWKCKVSQVSHIEKGDFIGYGLAFKAERKMTYATLPVGYADGLTRSLSNGNGRVFVNGQACSILGRVCMDMCMIDVSDLKVQEGDEVELLGSNQSVLELAQAAGTISYEVLAGIGARIPRLYLKD
ncbi:MAG: alanine racemase [Bacteroidota bacterium]|nr:alanine racemase [Bacteroidota bacterium]